MIRFGLCFLAFAFALPASGATGSAVLRNGDIFELRLSGMPLEYAGEFSLQYTVGDDGGLSIPQVSTPVRASGLSPTQLARAIEKRLVAEKIFTNPTAVIMVQAPSRLVTVGGAVRSANSILWSPDMTLSVAIKRVGGFGEFGNRKKVKVTREGKTSVFNQALYEKDSNRYQEHNPKLLPGDEVEVPGD